MLADITVARPAPGIAVIHVPAEFDVYTAPAIREAQIALVLDGVYSQVFDLTDTRVLDSTAMGVLVGAQKRLRAHDGVLVLDSPTVNVRHALTITGLVKIFHIVQHEYIGSQA